MSHNRIPELVEELQALHDHHVEIGILSGDADAEIIMIASVHEFGVEIQVTDKMRGFFKYQFGINLKKTTTHIRIPERSFIRGGFDKKVGDVEKKMEMLLDAVLMGKLTALAFYDAIGGQVASYLQEYIIELSTPKLSSLTVQRKGSDNPLVDTGRLGGSITWRVV